MFNTLEDAAVRDMIMCFLVGLLVLGASATWLPTQEAVDAAAGRDMRCLHREGKSNAFFYFDDADEEAAAYATPRLLNQHCRSC